MMGCRTELRWMGATDFRRRRGKSITRSDADAMKRTQRSLVILTRNEKGPQGMDDTVSNLAI